MPKPTFARESSCAGSAGLPYHLCPRVVGSYSFLPSSHIRLGRTPSVSRSPGHELVLPTSGLPLSLQPFRPSWEPLARGCKSGQARPPSLPWLNILAVSSPAVLGCCSRQPLPRRPPSPRWESLVPAPRAQPGAAAAAGDLHCFSSPYQSQSTGQSQGRGSQRSQMAEESCRVSFQGKDRLDFYFFFSQRELI